MRERFLKAIVNMAARRRKLVCITTLLLTIVTMGLSGMLKIDVRWSEMLPENLPVVQEFEKIDANYLQPGNMIVAVSGPNPNVIEQIIDEVEVILNREIVCAPEKIGAECKAEGRLGRYVYGKMPEQWMIENGLRLAKPNDARRMAGILGDPRLAPYLTHLNDDFEAEFSDTEAVANQERQIVSSLDAIQRWVEVFEAAAGGQLDDEEVGRTVRDLSAGSPYFLSLDKSMGLVMVASSVPSDDFEALPLLDKQVEALLAPLAAKYPDYRVERTGMTAIGRDELDSIGPITQLITMIALLLVFILLVWNFKSVVTPILALTPVVLGIIWAMGLFAVTLVTLNLMTVMIMVVLLGLGIDFTIHLSNRFTEEIAGGHDIEVALVRTVAGTGTGVVTGALTTAIAFFALSFADTKSISEFGIAAGIGVLTTLFASLWVLPALLVTVTARRIKKGKPAKTSHDFSALGRLAELMARLRYAVIILGVAGTGLGFYAATQIEWEWNFMELEPEGLRSIELQDEIIDRFKFSVSGSFLTAKTIEESRDLAKKLKSKRLVGDVDDISLWVSRPDFDQARPHLAKLRAAVAEERPAIVYTGKGEEVAANHAALAEELDRLWANLVEIQALSFTGGQDRVVEKINQIIGTRETRDQGMLKRVAAAYAKGEGIAWDKVQAMSDIFSAALKTRVVVMAAGDDPVTVDMVPDDILARYVSKSADGYLMQFYPRENLFEREKLEAFQETVTSVHPDVTGIPQMILMMSLETMREGRFAIFLALSVILILLLMDFRQPLVAFLAFIPLVSGLSLTFLTMWVMGEKLNYLNMIGLPVIIGIGVDNAVHFFHRYIQEGRGNMSQAVTSVGRAMLMTSLTTMIGFGSLMFYLMRGMASMGFVLFVGVGACFIVTITLLPALASVLENRIIKEAKK